ncbi:amino acid adenylation domain-containing protein [Hymenobacter aerilatus]|uniref:Amino acid adenylation domain-containing protein n=1 Tax=Hymenobacter aerilatus TaxID=2932251 RepID=A0A8T9ST33_9BACT|nr:polyketide synthase [Hymenobacter aerilatus]UOR05308.1 amino acid adenylation domain-containing protein [Hymenobacter aerilatus]
MDEIAQSDINVQYVQQLFELSATQHASQVALVADSTQFTYAQLDVAATQLSQQIQRQAGSTALVGISSTRGPAMIIGVLAILKAGKAYLPLDPAFSPQRLQKIITSSGLTHCLAPATEADLFTGLGLQVISDQETSAETTSTAAELGKLTYVLYTSGSTGEPKGVSMGHRSLLNLLHWQRRNSRAGSGTRTLQFAPLSFDVSFQEIMTTLTTGGTLVLVTNELRLDFERLLSFIQKQGINRLFLPFVALQYLVEAATHTKQFPACIQEVMTAGEQLKCTPQLVKFFEALPDCTLYNQYGPTECHVIITQLQLSGPPATWPALPTIGRPIDNVRILLTDEALRTVPDGEVGEICVTGNCLAEGYLHQPALTAEKFVACTDEAGQPMRLYHTGDLGRYLPDGTIEFLGRRDDQVKIRGHRIELGEVEVALNSIEGVQQAVVVARETTEGYKQLVAYLVATGADEPTAAVRAALEQQLPDYMVPAAFVWLRELPRTTSGKVDKKALPAPGSGRPALAALYRKPATPAEKNIAATWSELLHIEPVGADDNFFELGGNSLLAQKTVALLRQRFHYQVPITRLYQHPTVAGLARFLTPQAKAAPVAATAPSALPAATEQPDVAVIGMAGRFPGANTIAELWDVLREGRETIRFFTEEELDASIPNEMRHDPTYVRARGIIEEPGQFDAAFFGVSPKLAQVLDPQQRLFLEIAWEALEQAGYPPATHGAKVGVYAGVGTNTYLLHNVLGNAAVMEQVGAFQVMTANEKDYVASRTAYQLNLQGPAVSVHSACSTSLLAIAEAVKSIRAGQCELALAGGASITSPTRSGHRYQEGAMLSSDGHCRSFDAQGKGTVFSDGAGVVLLKSLAAAQRDGDTIYAVIKGIGVNNDGSAKGSFTAPNAEGQAQAIRAALHNAGVDPATISYVEAHGTATPLGDPIELEGLSMAFGPQAQNQFCAIGSIKSNMGHLTAAAGVAGFIKTALALHYRQLPPSLHFEQANPSIDFANSPFFVNTTLRDWTASTVRRAGISSFGVGGTNVHVVVEEAPVTEPLPTSARPVQLLAWSAKTATSRESYAGQLAHYLERDAAELADVAYTLHTVRTDFAQRRFVVASTPAEARTALQDASKVGQANTLQAAPGELVFLFPGQGAQYLGMGQTLYAEEPAYRQAVDECATLLLPYLALDIRTVLYAVPGAAAEAQLRQTCYTQPALFVTEYALARLWMSWGIVPSVLCGHSIGEFVAAHLAGVFSLADALRLVAVRGQLVGALPDGSMLAVRHGAAEVESLLPESLSIAAVNSRALCVVAGPEAAVAAFAETLAARQVPCRLLATSHAFHSAMMEPAVADFQQVVSTVTLHRPQKPVVSTVSGTWLTDAQATDPIYWAKHLRLPVQFADALDTLLALGNPLLLEVGPGSTATTLARQQAGTRTVVALPGLPPTQGSQTDVHAVLQTLGQLWLHGATPDWTAFYAGQNRRKVPLPTYVFDRQLHWLEPPVTVPVATQLAMAPPSIPITTSVAPAAALSTQPMRLPILLQKITDILENASGIEMSGTTPDQTFLEIGLDSLLLTQVALTLRKEFDLLITFRQLNEAYATPAALAAYLDQALPAERYQPVAVPAPSTTSAPLPFAPVSAPVAAPVPMAAHVAVASPDSALGLISQQLQLLARQIALLQGTPEPPVATPAPVALPAPVPAPTAPAPVASAAAELTLEEQAELKKPFGATARIERQATGLSQSQQSFLHQFTQRYNQKTAGSKAYAQQHRTHMADPRVVSGFRPLTKELVYPLVVNKSKGSRLWDIDGNEYIDVLNGFGSTMLGYQPDSIKQALHEQVERGYEIGPQHVLAGEVSQLICEFTGFDRAALCNTGSEAVLGAMRIARTVTGRSLIVAFSGSYHGIADEVLVRGTKKLKSFPAASGIMPEAVQNMLILDYGTEESLRIIRERAHELAAVLVEPVQSRRPEFRPIAFLREVRAITAAADVALIFDEVITGFRMHPGGAQALFGIKADLATYGKVVGGGLPIGAIAGRRELMDALDGGFWQYGDDSFPTVGVTYFAGTFVRHPLALAAAKASLHYMKEQGPALQQRLTAKAERLAGALNPELERRQLPFFVAHFGSLWKIKFHEEIPYAELLFTLLREKGVHIWDGFPCFMTEAHTTEEVDRVVALCLKSIDELVAAGFLPASPAHVVAPAPAGTTRALNQPPVSGARLGRDQLGNPAWFISDPEQPDHYLQINLN